MKRALATVFVSASLFALSSNAQAFGYAGLRLGFPEFGVQLGSTSVFGPNLGGRLTADFAYNASSILVGADILYTAVIPTPSASFDLDVYFGGGLGIVIPSNGNRIGYTAHGVLGMNFYPSRTFSIFAEVRPFGFGTAGFYYGGALGLNFRL